MPSTKSVAIPIKSKQQDKTEVATFLKENLILSKETENVLKIIEMKLPLAKKRLIVPPQRVLTEAVQVLFESRDVTLTDELKTEIPDSWEKHGDLILLHGHHFCSDHWKVFGRLTPRYVLVRDNPRMGLIHFVRKLLMFC